MPLARTPEKNNASAGSGTSTKISRTAMLDIEKIDKLPNSAKKGDLVRVTSCCTDKKLRRCLYSNGYKKIQEFDMGRRWSNYLIFKYERE